MIDKVILRRTREAIGAVGFRKASLEQIKESAGRSLHFEILGTCFVVADGLAMTNRHVTMALSQAHNEQGVKAKDLLIDIVSSNERDQHRTGLTQAGLNTPAEWIHRFVRIKAWCALPYRDLDLGFVRFDALDGISEAIGPIAPLPIVENRLRAEVGDPIAVCGYAFGTSHLEPDASPHRHGPIIQQGYISAISPFDAAAMRAEYVLDIRTAPGMSGAPVINDSGEVIGLHWGGRGSVLALAAALDRKQVEEFIASIPPEVFTAP